MARFKHIRLILTALIVSLLAILLDFIAHKTIFEPAYATFEPEIFAYYAVKFLVILAVYILFMLIFSYAKSQFISSRILRPVIIAFVAMMLFATYYYFNPSNTNPAVLPFSFFPFMGLNHFLDILISMLITEAIFRIKTGKNMAKRDAKKK